MARPNVCYLDNAATSWPKPPAVVEAVAAYLRDKAGNPGRGCHRLALEAESVVKEARIAVARFVGAPQVSRVVFTASCTDATNIAIKGLLHKTTTGDGSARPAVVMSGLEHNAVSRPLRALELDGAIRLSIARPDRATGVVPLDAWRDALTAAQKNGPVALVACAHASNLTGTIQPIDDIAAITHECGARILVDAAQTAGHVPLNIAEAGVDMLALAGHKGLLGPQGIGMLCLAEDVELTPWREGGTGGDSMRPVQPDEYPYHLEAGTPNTPAMAGLTEGIRWLRDHGVEALHEHEVKLTQRLLDFLREQGDRVLLAAPEADGAARTGVVSFRLENMEPEDLGIVLDGQFGIAGRSGIHCTPLAHESFGTLPAGLNRFSVGPFNTIDDIDRLIAGLKEALAA